MKRTKSLLVILLLLLCLSSGCRGQSDLPSGAVKTSKSETTSIFTSESTEPTMPIVTSAFEVPVTDIESEMTAAPTETATPNLVEDVYCETGEFMGIALSYRIPRVLIEGEEIDRANDELYDAAFSRIMSSLESVEDGSEPYIISSSYEWAVNGDILSLHYMEELFYDDYILHTVYNYSISHGTVLSKEELLQLIGWTLPDFEEKCRQVLISELFKSLIPEEFEQTRDEVEIGWQWYEAYSGTLTDENIRTAVPFLNEKGHLCMLGYAYTLYAGGGDSFVIDLEEYEVSPYYSKSYQIGDVIVLH